MKKQTPKPHAVNSFATMPHTTEGRRKATERPMRNLKKL